MNRLCLLILFFVFQSAYAEPRDNIVKTMEQLAQSQNMEFVYGNRFPVINPYGSYGSTFVLDFESEGKSIFFLARKPHEQYQSKKQESTLDLIRHYDYFYIHASQLDSQKNFKIKNILKNKAALKGFTLFFGSIDFSNKGLFYVEDNERVNGEIDQSLLGIPILISSETVTTFLFYYKGKWVELVERGR